MENELPVQVIVEDDKMDNKTTIIFALKAHTSTTKHSVTNSDGIGTVSPTLADFNTIQSADEVFKNATKITWSG